MASDESENQLPPPASRNEINLAYADIVIHAILFPIVLFITWKHGKKGMVCWPIFASYFVLHFVAKGYQLANQDKPDIPNAVSIFTHSGSIACLMFGLIGIIYEVNLTVPCRGRRWGNMSMLGITHIMNTTGVALATYGGSPKSGAPDGVASYPLNIAGNFLMISVLVITCLWWAISLKRAMVARVQGVWPLCKLMLLAAGVGIAFQAVIFAHSTTYAFDRMVLLDPTMGTFATTLVLGFGAQLGVTLSLIIGGWLSRDIHQKETEGSQLVSVTNFRFWA